MIQDVAAEKIIDLGSVGAMLILACLAIAWLAKVFKQTTEDHTNKIIEITAKHAQQIDEKDRAYSASINAIVAEFKEERLEMAIQHAQERKDVMKVLSDNTAVLQNLYHAIEKRQEIELRGLQR